MSNRTLAQSIRNLRATRESSMMKRMLATGYRKPTPAHKLQPGRYLRYWDSLLSTPCEVEIFLRGGELHERTPSGFESAISSAAATTRWYRQGRP